MPKVIGMIEGLGNAFTPYKEGKTQKAKIVQVIQVLLYKISPLLG
ncbi:putative glycosyl transferase [Actinobacillus equuli]|nr:putative glycosyl transferase [Actinobacillus equuli]